MSDSRTVTVTVGDRELTLYFGINELIGLRDHLGVEDAGALNSISAIKAKPDVLRAMMLFMLKKHQPDTTIESAGEIIDELGFSEACRVIVDTFAKGFNLTGLTGSGGKAPARSPSTRSSSTSSRRGARRSVSVS